MASLLQQAADIITTAAGWQPAAPEDGAYHFALEGDLDMTLLSPENRTGVLRADLGALPASAAEADALCARLGKLAVGVMKKRRSTLALANGRLELYRTFSLTDRQILASPSPLPGLVRDFLNDLAWWKQHVAEGAPAASFSPFSMGGWPSMR